MNFNIVPKSLNMLGLTIKSSYLFFRHSLLPMTDVRYKQSSEIYISIGIWIVG